MIKRYNLQYYPTNNKAQAEIRARDLLRRVECVTRWVPVPIYPAGGAAGALLLYVLTRALRELPVTRVLELGAGQTTRLLDSWARAHDGTVVTFEHDLHWATKVAETVDPSRTQVLHLPLEDYPAPGCSVKWYGVPRDNVLPRRDFDLVVVDGPVGTKRYSRYGIVERIPEWLNKDWAVIWDDLDRPADLESFGALVNRLRSMNVAHDHVILDGDRTIGLVHSMSFAALRYMW